MGDEFELPPAVRELQRKQEAFKVPDWQLPDYTQFGKSADSVLTRDGDKLAARKPSFVERQDEDNRRISGYDALNPIAEYSKTESAGFTNPLLPYDPTVDMVDLYARYDPVTWGDSFDKLWDTARLNTMSGTQNLWSGLKEGLTEGRVSAIWDNKYSQELAQMTENMEKLKPVYFSEDQQDTKTAWLKQLLPSLGYVASSVAEMAVQHGVMTLGGAAIGALTGGGIGAVPGAIAGNVVALGRDVQTAATALTNISRTARAISTLSTANKIKKGAQLFGYGLLSANGEAALNAQMAKNASLEKAKRDHYQRTGTYLSGEELALAEKDANSTGNVTAALNLPLISATNIFEFGNLIRGKAGPSVIDKLAFKIDKATGKAVAKNAAIKVLSVYGAQSASEGFEEFAQGVIEDATADYYTRKVEDRNGLLGAFADSAYKRAKSGEGASEFLGGALIGGISNVAELGGYGAVKSNTQRFVDDYNTSTSQYFEQFANALYTDASLRDAVKTGDKNAVRAAYQKGLTMMVNAHARAGSSTAFEETLDAMTDMDNAEFQQTFGIAVTPEEQTTLLLDMTNDYRAAAKVRRTVDGAFTVNPFQSESWLQQRLNKMNPAYNVDQAGAAKIWEVFKDTVTSNVYQAEQVGGRVDMLAGVGRGLSTNFERLVGTDVASTVSQYREVLQARIDANLPNRAELEAELAKIDAHTDLGMRYKAILAYEEQFSPGVSALVSEYNMEAGMLKLLQDQVGRLNRPAGQRKELKKIVDWHLQYEKKLVDVNSIQPIAPAVAPVVAPNPTPVAAPVTVAQGVAPVAAAPAVAPTAEDVVSAASEAEVILPDYDAYADEEYVPDTQVDENLAEQYGEGITEDSPPQTPPSPKPEVTETLVVPQVLDSEMPEGLRVDEAALAEAIVGLRDGEEIDPSLSGIQISNEGEEILTIKKQDGELSYDTDNEKGVPLQRSEIAGLEIVESDDSISRFISENKMDPAQISFFTKLQKGYTRLKC